MAEAKSTSLAEAHDLEQRQTLQERIVQEYDDPADQAATLALLAGIEGVDLETGIALGDEPGKKPEADPDKKPEGGDDPDKKVIAGPTEDAEVIPYEELQSTRAKVVSLQTRLDTIQAGDAIREKVQTGITATRAQWVEEDKPLLAKIAEVEEAYGEDAAKAMKDILGARQADREQIVQLTTESETRKLTDAREADAQADQEIHRDIDASADLRAWKANSDAFKGGDTTKSAENWNMALAVDAALLKNEVWANKPQPERFTEVVKLVKLSTGASSAGTPGASDKTEKDLETEIAKQAAGAKTDLPPSLSVLPGGEAPKDLDAKLETMSAAEIEALGLTPEQIDAISERLEEGAA